MSEKKSKAGSLLEKEATGGEIAEHGFSFQEGMLLARLPAWLAQSGFSQAIREALGGHRSQLLRSWEGKLPRVQRVQRPSTHAERILARD